MSDDLIHPIQPDRSKINMSEDYEVDGALKLLVTDVEIALRPAYLPKDLAPYLHRTGAPLVATELPYAQGATPSIWSLRPDAWRHAKRHF